MRPLGAADIVPPTGQVDRFVRRFPAIAHGIAGAALYAIAAVALGLAAWPAAYLAGRFAAPLLHADAWWRWPALGLLASVAVLTAGLALLAVVPALNAILPTRLRPSTGSYYTAASVPWYLHNGLLYLVRYTVLPFVTATPVGVLFLRAMGMRAGRRPRIMTEFFSDVTMITLGDDVTIGGSATIFCHYGGNGRLVIAPVVIGSNATIGEKATVMGDVVVGDGATILPHAVLLPHSRVGPRERWGGAPARRIGTDEWEAMKRATGAGAS